MKEANLHAPQLCPMAQCDAGLQFSPRLEWPEGLPAVAVNSVIFAGFSQEMVFNHSIPLNESEKIASLFRSLYFELSFVEAARLIEKAAAYSWLPLSLILSKFGWQPTDQFFKVAETLLKTPVGFQNWCSDKKVGPQDLLPLISAGELELKFLYHDILQFGLSKSLGVKALELGIELILMGHVAENLSSERLLTFVPKNESPGEAWVSALKHLRYPETFKRDQEQAKKMSSLPWPGSSQAKWTRQGDRAGIELKLFVTQPSDLKKYMQSLAKVQEMLEKETSGTKN